VLKSRSTAERHSRFFMAGIPLALALVLAAAMVAWLVATWVGTNAEGEQAVITLTADCDLTKVTTERAKAVGFGAFEVTTQGKDTVLTGRLPGLPDDETAMPALLSAEGKLRVLAADTEDGPGSGEPLATEVDLTAAWLQIGMSGHPYVLLDVQPNALTRIQEAEAASWVFELDGVEVDRFVDSHPPEDDDLRIQPKLERTRDEVRMATDWAVILSSPLPCPVRHVAVTKPTG
jgi:hypothetical protein